MMCAALRSIQGRDVAKRVGFGNHESGSMPVIYSAMKRFDPARREDWQKFIVWSRLTQLLEVISLDEILCPFAFDEISDEDWRYNVHEDFKTHFFHDLDYVLKKVAGNEQLNVLALMENPTENEVRTFGDSRFDFRGFDLVDHVGGISALINCGGFPKAFAPTELSNCGLLTEYENARKVQKLLRSEYPNEPHAECNMWAIWKMNRG
jgi:hypothetical protein